MNKGARIKERRNRMLKQNGYAQYQNAKIMTASPAELTLMLYDGAIKFGNIAILGMENNDPAKAREHCQGREDHPEFQGHARQEVRRIKGF